MTLFCSGVPIVLMRTFFQGCPSRRPRTKAYRRVAKGMRNPRRVRDAQLRISFLTLTVLLGGPPGRLCLRRRTEAGADGYLLTVLTTIVLHVRSATRFPAVPYVPGPGW